MRPRHRPACCRPPPATPAAPALAAPLAEAAATPASRSGRDIYAAFRDGLADPACEPGASARWRDHFDHVPRQLARQRDDDVLALFGYVVDSLRAAHLPTEYALIPFVESGYRPGARSTSGPAGLWQFIAVTARNHRIAIRPGYDGRLSPVDSTTAAVRYLKTLHGMLAGDWRLTVMAFNAGEYRVFGALKRHGQVARDADPAALTSLSPLTQAYVRKLHALSCLLLEAGEQPDWLASLDRPVPVLAAKALPPGRADLDGWAQARGHDAAQLKRLNPALAERRVASTSRPLQVLAPDDGRAAEPDIATSSAPASPAPADAGVDATTAAAARTHVVARGDSASRIARRHGIALRDLLSRNGLDAKAVLRPGMVLRIDTPPDAAAATPVAN